MFAAGILDGRVKLYVQAVLENLEAERSSKVLPPGRAGFLVVMANDLALQTVAWMNERACTPEQPETGGHYCTEILQVHGNVSSLTLYRF